MNRRPSAIDNEDGSLLTMKTKRPYNVYNIFFLLERARLLQEASVEDAKRTTTNFLSHPDVYPLSLPELPPRYHGLNLPSGWYMPWTKAKRKHVATNGRESTRTPICMLL